MSRSDNNDSLGARLAGLEDPGALGRLRVAVAARADAEGLLDVAWTTTDSPVGALLLAASPRGLLRIAYTAQEASEAVLDRLAARISPRVLERPERLDEPRRQLEQYFSGARRAFELDCDPALIGPYARRVLGRTAQIPFGATLSYAEVAAEAGSPRGARAAGNALGSNPIPIVIPCHRVLRAGGTLGGYTGGLDRKRTLLALEGVRVIG